MTAGNDGTAAPRPGPEIFRITLAAVAAALLGWAVLRSAAMNAAADGTPSLDLLVSADDPRTVLAEADSAVRKRRGDVDAGVEQSAMRASKRLPLDATPFLVAGGRALRAGDLARAEKLLVEAQARDPRSRAARFLLLELYVRAGQAHEAAEEMATLTRLIPNARPLLVAGLARFAESFGDGRAMARVLEDDPAIRNAVLERLAASGEKPELIAAVAEGFMPPRGAAWPGYLIDSLVERGDVRQAYDYWRRVAGLSPEEPSTGVFNPRFDALSAPPPFNWSFGDGKAGAARPGAGLEVEYRGGAEMKMARQLVLLAPGHYRLSFDAKGETLDKEGQLVWKLACAGSAAPLASAPVEAWADLPKSTQVDFTIPEGCTAQWLTLLGVPGGKPDTIRLTLSAFEIARSDAS